jgi:hypothetical protein
VCVCGCVCRTVTTVHGPAEGGCNYVLCEETQQEPEGDGTVTLA